MKYMFKSPIVKIVEKFFFHLLGPFKWRVVKNFVFEYFYSKIAFLAFPKTISTRNVPRYGLAQNQCHLRYKGWLADFVNNLRDGRGYKLIERVRVFQNYAIKAITMSY